MTNIRRMRDGVGDKIMPDIRNLRREILTVLEANGKTSADVRWAGARNGALALSWEEFARLADRDYDAGYGYCEVATDLVVVGDDWWLQRHCYAGKEWWQYNTPPLLGKGLPFKRIFAEAADRSLEDPKLADMNRDDS